MYVPESVEEVLRFAARETYPLEGGGALLGHWELDERLRTVALRLHAAVPFQMAERRRATYSAKASIQLAEEHLDDRVGEFHTHPDDRPTLSKDGTEECDFEEMRLGEVEAIVGVGPGRRGDLRFVLRVYQKITDRCHRRMPIRRTR